MDTNKLNNEKEKKFWISITGYRTLVILKALMERSRTIDELVEILENLPYLNNAISKDTVRLSINTLKAAGCIMTRPSKANNYLYKIISHPYNLEFNNDEIEALINLREKLAEEFSWREVLIMNSLYLKIIDLVPDCKLKDLIINTEPLISVNKDVLKELANPNIFGKKISIRYKSPKYDEEDIEIIPQKLSYEDSKIHLFCYSYKYNKNSILNVERILQINKIDISETFDTPSTYYVTYKLKGDSFKTFVKTDYEEILEKTSTSVIVKAKVDNEFIFMQRILYFGADFKIISPDFFKEKLIDKIKQIRKRYEL